MAGYLSENSFRCSPLTLRDQHFLFPYSLIKYTHTNLPFPPLELYNFIASRLISIEFQAPSFKIKDPSSTSSKFRVPSSTSSKFRVPRVPSSEFQVQISSSEFRVPSSEFRVPSSEFRAPSSEFRVPSSKFRVQGLSSKFQNSSSWSSFRFPNSEFVVFAANRSLSRFLIRSCDSVRARCDIRHQTKGAPSPPWMPIMKLLVIFNTERSQWDDLQARYTTTENQPSHALYHYIP